MCSYLFLPLVITVSLVQGEGMTSIEPTAGAINDICAFSGSGLMLLALDCSQIPSYFIPALGPAPKWCTYLENLTACLLLDSCISFILFCCLKYNIDFNGVFFFIFIITGRA